MEGDDTLLAGSLQQLPYTTVIPINPQWEDSKQPLGNNEVHVWRFDLMASVPGHDALLSNEEQHRYATLKHADATRQFRNSRIHLRKILAAYLDAPPASLRLTITPAGKPELNSQLLHFNLTHSHGLGLLAVSRDIPVGIDMEKLRSVPHALRIAKRLFPQQSFDLLSKMPEEQRQIQFFREWTAMEARQKALGQGIFENRVSAKQMHCQHIRVKENFIAAVATESRHPFPGLRFFNASTSAYDAA